MDVVSSVGLVTGLVCVLILAPITIWLLVYFYELREAEIMKHRQKILVYYMNIITISGLIFQWASLSLNVWNVSINHGWTVLIYIIDNSFLWCIFALFCVKTWLLFYDKQYHASVATQAWKQQINSRYKSWYITNKHKWGNFNFIMKVIFIPLICCTILETVFELLFFLEFNIHSMLVLSIIFLIPSLIMHCLLKGFDDIFGIKQEILYQIIVMFIILCIHLLELEMLFKFKFDHRTDWLIAIIISSVTLFLMSFISTAYPIYLHRKQCEMHRLAKYQANIAERISVSPSSSSSQPSKPPTNRLGHMLTVIADENGFNAFMNHLINEFATESLLFLVELIQIKHEYLSVHSHTVLTPQSAIQRQQNPFNFMKVESLHSLDTQRSDDTNIPMESYIMNEKGDIWAKVSLPIGIPRSESLTANQQLKDQMYALYCKYVRVDSLHTLNIAYAQRKDIDEYFDGSYRHIINELQQKHKLNIQVRSVESMKTVEMRDASHDSHPSKAPPNTPRPEDHEDPHTNDTNIPQAVKTSPKSPSKSYSRSRTRSRSRSRGKVGLKETLSTPILEGVTDEFPNVPHIEDRIKPKPSPVAMPLDIDPDQDIEDIPDDFRVILDYNMNEEAEEETLDVVKEDDDGDKNSDEDDDEHKVVEMNVVDDGDEHKKEENEEDKKLVHILDGVCMEVIELLFGPYLRFIKTQNGKRVFKALIVEDQ